MDYGLWFMIFFYGYGLRVMVYVSSEFFECLSLIHYVYVFCVRFYCTCHNGCIGLRLSRCVASSSNQ